MARCNRVAAGTALMAFKCAIAAGTWPDNNLCAAGENPADKKNNAAHVAVGQLTAKCVFHHVKISIHVRRSNVNFISKKNHGWLTR